MRDREKERNIRLPESYVQQGGPVRPPRPSRARRAADERAGERQRGDLQPQPILLRLLFLPGVCLCRGVRHLGVVHVADILHLVALAVAVMVQVVFVFVIHR